MFALRLRRRRRLRIRHAVGCDARGALLIWRAVTLMSVSAPALAVAM
jgi:hypothetical protein